MRQAARAAYQEGDVLYAAGDWTGAYEQYQRAHQLIPTVNTAYWTAVCLDRMGKPFDAALAYGELLQREDVAKLGEQRVADVHDRHQQLKQAAVSTLKLTTKPVARIGIDGRARGETPLEVALPPGRHEIVLEADGYRTERIEVALAPGKMLDETLELQPLPQPKPRSLSIWYFSASR